MQDSDVYEKQVEFVVAGGIVKAAGFGAGPTQAQFRHRQAAFDDATRALVRS